jgi:hypothetical protein
MDSMFGDKKNLKDSQESVKDTSSMPAPYQAGGFGAGSYTKTQKLIIALYMVTDIVDKDEPLRNKLRTLGTGIISDTHSHDTLARTVLASRISEIMSFLDIASAMNIISEMNCNILRKEFLKLDQSIKESGDKAGVIDRKINLSEFFTEEESQQNTDSHPSLLKDSYPNGHHNLGIQKGKNLLKVLKDINSSSSVSFRTNGHLSGENFDILKKQRRQDILNIIKIMGGSATIKDIKDKVKSLSSGGGSLSSCGEKTLQRELVSMVRDGVLNKTGEKRWSRYFVK